VPDRTDVWTGIRVHVRVCSSSVIANFCYFIHAFVVSINSLQYSAVHGKRIFGTFKNLGILIITTLFYTITGCVLFENEVKNQYTSNGPGSDVCENTLTRTTAQKLFYPFTSFLRFFFLPKTLQFEHCGYTCTTRGPVWNNNWYRARRSERFDQT